MPTTHVYFLCLLLVELKVLVNVSANTCVSFLVLGACRRGRRSHAHVSFLCIVYSCSFFCIVFHVFLCRVSCNHVSCIFFGACRGSRCSRGCVSYLCVFVYLLLYHVLCICVTFLVHAGAGVASRGCVSFFVCIPIYFVSCMVYSCIFFFGACGSRCS